MAVNKTKPLASKSHPGGATRHPLAGSNAHGSHQGDMARNMDQCGSDCGSADNGCC